MRLEAKKVGIALIATVIVFWGTVVMMGLLLKVDPFQVVDVVARSIASGMG